MQWKAPRMWDGEDCIIIGGGTSILKQFDVPTELIQSVYEGKSTPAVYSPYMEAIHNKHIIAVNMAFTFGDWIDVLFFGDDGFYKKKRTEINAFQGLRVSCCNDPMINDCRIKNLHKMHSKKLGISTDSRAVCWNFNSGGAAINVAVHFGVKRILLLGFDMKLDEKANQHWHKFYHSNPKTVGSTFNQHMKGFPVMVEELKGKVEIINCSMESKIDCFPKANIKDVL